MISIRAHLLWWLLPGFIAVCFVAGFGIYFSTGNELQARLDAQLAELVDAIRSSRQGLPGAPETRGAQDSRGSQDPRGTQDSRGSSGQQGDGRRVHRQVSRPQIDEDTLISILPEDVYCDVVLSGVREDRIATPNLGDGSIPAPPGDLQKMNLYNTKLDSGIPVRVRTERIVLPGPIRAHIRIAISREGIDATLSHLAVKLVAGGFICYLVLSGILAAALHLALRPLRRLGEQASAMTADSLHERFPEKEIPSDIRPIVKRLNRLMATLEESFVRERRFSGDLAHELRTPLAAIRSTSEVAAKWPEQASGDDFVEISRIAAQLQQTLDSLLLLARMESSAAETLREPVGFAGLVTECISLHSAAALEKNLTWTVQLDEGLQLETDPRLLRIILSNLIRNAVEHAPEQSEIILSSHTGDVLFRCTNTAPNLGPDDLSHLYERLWQKDTARTESGHTGLGLSIAKTCAKVLGFSLTAELDEQNRLCMSLNS
jgi:signal transduction histidine kinase